MENIIGKKFQYKGSNEIKTVKDVKNGRVYFTDNGNIEEFKLYENFKELTILENQKVNVDTFFEPEFNLNSNFGSLINQIEQFKTNPSAFVRNIENNDTSEYQQPNIINGQDVSGLTPETIRWIKEEEEKQKIMLQKRKNGNIDMNDPWMKQFVDSGGEVKRYDANINQEELDRVTKINNGEYVEEKTNYSKKSTQNINQGMSLPKMKKTFKVKFNLEINEMIPKIDDIKAVENLFEVSLLEGIAKEIADKYINNKDLLENMILSELEKIVNKKKSKKTIVKKINVIK
jgi:hypothetical protein